MVKPLTLRRAIEVRDRICFHPNCDEVPRRPEIDHIDPAAQGGAPTQDNGRLACGFHNRHRNHHPGLGRWVRPRRDRREVPPRRWFTGHFPLLPAPPACRSGHGPARSARRQRRPQICVRPRSVTARRRASTSAGSMPWPCQARSALASVSHASAAVCRLPSA
ncbi:hypothetical protein BH24ACT3_BH24ACT3_00560 [soil metagenome]